MYFIFDIWILQKKKKKKKGKQVIWGPSGFNRFEIYCGASESQIKGVLKRNITVDCKNGSALSPIASKARSADAAKSGPVPKAAVPYCRAAFPGGELMEAPASSRLLITSVGT